MLFFNFFRAIIPQNTRGEPPIWFTGMILWTSKNLTKSVVRFRRLSGVPRRSLVTRRSRFFYEGCRNYVGRRKNLYWSLIGRELNKYTDAMFFTRTPSSVQ